MAFHAYEECIRARGSHGNFPVIYSRKQVDMVWSKEAPLIVNDGILLTESKVDVNIVDCPDEDVNLGKLPT